MGTGRAVGQKMKQTKETTKEVKISTKGKEQKKSCEFVEMVAERSGEAIAGAAQRWMAANCVEIGGSPAPPEGRQRGGISEEVPPLRAVLVGEEGGGESPPIISGSRLPASLVWEACQSPPPPPLPRANQERQPWSC